MAMWGDGKDDDEGFPPAGQRVDHEPTRFIRPQHHGEPVEYAERREVRSLSRIGRRLVLQLQRDRRVGDERVARQLINLDKRESFHHELTGERILFVTQRLEQLTTRLVWLERVSAFAVLVICCALLVVMCSGCSGPAFVAGDGSSSSAGAVMEPDRMSSASSGAGAAGVGGTSSSSSGAPAGGAAQATDAGAGAGGEPASSHACDRERWTASAWAEWVDAYGGPAAFALDGDEATRWSGGAKQEPGQWFAVEFGGELELELVRLRAVQVPTDAPKLVTLELDGVAVHVRQTHPSAGELVLELERPRLASRLRVELVGESPAWWSIDELTAQCR